MDSISQFLEYCNEGNLLQVKQFLKNNNIDPAARNNYAIRKAR